ncbi:MAG: hypothetical protein LBG52_00825 [Candidatus Peribacteria bacterium]|jgi:hypothetical protein|nr:hypothetical protein [Candidatus Peribacteria bacterium]
MVDSLNAVPEDIKQPSPQEIKKLFTELRGSDKITPEMKALMKETLMHKKHETYKDDLKKIYFAFYSSPAGNVKKEDQVKAF